MMLHAAGNTKSFPTYTWSCRSNYWWRTIPDFEYTGNASTQILILIHKSQILVLVPGTIPNKYLPTYGIPVPYIPILLTVKS